MFKSPSSRALDALEKTPQPQMGVFIFYGNDIHTYNRQKILHVFSIKYLKHTILCPLPIIQLSHKVTKRKVLQ